jgi:hypothetical protein
MVEKPANAEEAIKQYREYRATQEKNSNRPTSAEVEDNGTLRIHGLIKMPGKVQYSMRHLGFSIERKILKGKKDSDLIREICVDVGPLILELEPKTAQATNSNIPKATPPYTPTNLPSSSQLSEPTPELDPAYLDTLGWKDFSPGPGQWIVAETSGAQALDEELTRSGQTIEIGTYRYRLSFGRPDKEGKRRKFVNRYPVT